MNHSRNAKLIGRTGTRLGRARQFGSLERGQVIPLFALMLVALIGFGAFAVDVSGWFASRRNLQKGADPAALAGAELYAASVTGQTLPAGCSGQTTATACAAYIAGLNNVATDGTPTLATSGNNTTVTVNAKDENPPIVFASIFGIHPTIRASASATAGPSGGGGNVMPFAFNATAASNWTSGQVVQYGYDTQTGQASGNWGLLAIGACGGNSTTDISGCITPLGCQCSLVAPVWVPASSGNKWNSNGVNNAFDNNLIKVNPQPVVFVPVYDTTNGTGTNAQYHIVGFAGFIVTYYSAQGHNIVLKGKFHGIINGFLCSGSCSSFGAFAVALTS
jgi:Flp pilus assembly protein TadG